jgi:hypothetical protein
LQSPISLRRPQTFNEASFTRVALADRVQTAVEIFGRALFVGNRLEIDEKFDGSVETRKYEMYSPVAGAQVASPI